MKNGRPVSEHIYDGIQEPIFSVLPQRVVENFGKRASENALLWNTFYPRRNQLDLAGLFELRPNWGTMKMVEPEPLEPYFWGYGVDGSRLRNLDLILNAVDGAGQKTEIDLFLLGKRSLVVVEAKNTAHLGRCQRFQQGRCPEVQKMCPVQNAAQQYENCRYWHVPEARFDELLHISHPLARGDGSRPACDRHYQLARTLLIGSRLAASLELQLCIWLLMPHRRWSAFEKTWLDFSRFIRKEEVWRNARVISWETVGEIASC